jgi:hypothetical protein
MYLYNHVKMHNNFGYGPLYSYHFIHPPIIGLLYFHTSINMGTFLLTWCLVVNEVIRCRLKLPQATSNNLNLHQHDITPTTSNNLRLHQLTLFCLNKRGQDHTADASNEFF